MMATDAEIIAHAKELLADREIWDYGAVAYPLMLITEKFDNEPLQSLAWLLAHEQYGVSKNDVIGLIELIEFEMDKQVTWQPQSITEAYRIKFESKDQKEIGEDAVCEKCGKPVLITDFRTAGALEVYCCGSGNDEGYCQTCQDTYTDEMNTLPDSTEII